MTNFSILRMSFNYFVHIIRLWITIKFKYPLSISNIHCQKKLFFYIISFCRLFFSSYENIVVNKYKKSTTKIYRLDEMFKVKIIKVHCIYILN